MQRLTHFERAGLIFDVLDEGPIDGDTIVLLHGFPQTNTCWHAVAPLLHAAGYRTIAPNQRGYAVGARPKGRRAYRMRELVADAAELIDAVGGRVDVVAHDWGAAVGWMLAAQHPDLVRTYTAISVPHVGAFMRSMPKGQLLKSYYMLVFNIPWLPERLLGHRVTARLLLRRMTKMPKEAFAQYRKDFIKDRGRLRGGLGWYRAMILTKPRDLFKKVAVPTTYIWSTGDVFLGRAGAELTRKYVSGDYRFEIIEGGSHWSPETNPNTIAQLILERVKG